MFTTQQYEAYQNVINLELYHAFEWLIAKTSELETAMAVYREGKAEWIWTPALNPTRYFEQFNLRYPGEVLERFEERLGADIRTIRALALALGHTTAIQTATMFVGGQRRNFIQKIRSMAGDDIYLQGALYLLETDADRKRSMLKGLEERIYRKTEEALFVLALHDNPDDGYRMMGSQLPRLFGSGRTISLEQNFGILEWLACRYARQIKASRTKDHLVLRTLLKLPYMNLRKDCREFAILLSCGYSAKEIALANSYAVWAERIRDRVSPNGIVAEKIAARCCVELLNSCEALSPEEYKYIGDLMNCYAEFRIRYDGHEGIWDAVVSQLNPTVPETISWMRQDIQKKFPYRFDVFDPRYDLLTRELSHRDYSELFTEQMLRYGKAAPVRVWLARYRELTGTDYMECFSQWMDNTSRAFAYLVERKEIRLWKFFEQHKNEGPEAVPMRLLEDYAMEIKSWQGFRFVRKLQREYSFQQIQSFFGNRYRFHSKFARRTYREYEINFPKGFLSNEERKELFDWMETSVFLTEPDSYEEFIWEALSLPEIQHLFEKDQLAQVLRLMLKHNGKEDTWNARKLKNTLYSREELELERQAEAEQELLRKQLAEQEKKEKREQDMENTYDGSMSSLNTFVSQHYHDGQAALDMAYEKLKAWPTGRVQLLERTELGYFFKLCGEMVERGTLAGLDVFHLIGQMTGGELQ